MSVWRENKGWKGPYKIAAIEGHSVTVDMTNGPVTFRSTHVLLYKRQEDALESGSFEDITSTTPNHH